MTVTVAPEASKTLITVPTFDATTGNETGNAPVTIVYGTPTAVRVDVGNSQASQTFPERLVCAPLNCPTGSITLTDSLNGGAPSPLGPTSSFALNNGGYAEDDAVALLSGGTHMFGVGYSGDNSYNSSSNTYTLTVTRGATRIISSNPPLPPTVATPFNLGAILTMNFFGGMPNCNFIFYDGTTPMQGAPNCTWQANGPFLYVTLPVSQATAGVHTYSAKFTGDSNYNPSSSATMTTQVFYGTTTNLSVSSTNVQYGTQVTLTGTVDSTVMQGPAIANTVGFFSGADAVPGSVTYAPTKDSSGNTALIATLTFTPQSSGWYYAYFPGDSSYYQSSANSIFITVNIPTFSVAANQTTSLPVTAGQSAMTTITVTPTSSATSPVSLTCALSDIPGSSCNFSPSTVTLSNSTAENATLKISVLSPSASNTTTSAPPVPYFSPSSNRQKVCLLVMGMTCLLFLLFSRRSRAYRTAGVLGLACLIGAFAISCGSSGGSGGPGSGAGNSSGGQVATSLSLVSSSIKAPVAILPTIQAKVNSSRSVSGSIVFYDAGNIFETVNVLPDGTATATLAGYSALPGTHIITASYSGDSNNMASKTNGALNQVITGATYMNVLGTTGGLTEGTSFTVTIQ